MKIVVLDGYTLNPGDISWEGLERMGQLTVYDRTKPEEVLERIKTADIVFTNKTPLTKEVLEVCRSIRFIGVLATGYNIVDVEAAKTLGIKVANIPLTERQRWRSLQLPFCWSCAIMWANIQTV